MNLVFFVPFVAGFVFLGFSVPFFIRNADLA